MTGKTFRGLGWLSVIFWVGACNTADKAAEGRLTSKITNDRIEHTATGAAKETPAAAAEPPSQTVTVSGDRPAVAMAAVSPAAVRGGGSDTAPFLGTWTTRAESHLSNCGGAAVSDAIGTSITWSAGTTGHIQAELVGKCVLDAKVNGNVATAADQTCNDNGIYYVVGGTFNLQSDGTARLNEHVRATGRGVNCTGTLSGTYQKFSP
jgi:hypothetical protein